MRSYHITEMFVQGKRPDTICEDMVEDLDGFIVLLDGVTGKDGARYMNTTGGRFAAETIMDALRAMDRTIDGPGAITAVSQHLRDAIIAERGHMPLNPPGAQFAVYSAHRSEIWAVGDTHVRIGDDHAYAYPPPTDAIATEFRAAILESLLLRGATIEDLVLADPTWESMLPLLSRQDAFANLPDLHPLGYGVINGLPVPPHHIRVIHVPGGEVALASDGYLSAMGTLEDAEADLRRTIERDPLLFRLHKSFRAAPAGGSFDDRAWVRFAVS